LNLIILTVQSSGRGDWRLGLSAEDSRNKFSHLETVKFVLLNETIECNAACGTSSKKAFDFNNRQLSKWILNNKFDRYTPRKPTKLIFGMTYNSRIKVLTFINEKTSP